MDISMDISMDIHIHGNPIFISNHETLATNLQTQIAGTRQRSRNKAKEHEMESKIIGVFRCRVAGIFVQAQLQWNMPLHSYKTTNVS